MNLKYIKFVIGLSAFTLMITLSGCGGNGKNGVATDVNLVDESTPGDDGEISDVTNNTKIEIEIKDLNISLDNTYKIVTEDETVQISGAKPIVLTKEYNSTTPVILANKYDEPILYALKKNDDKKIDITLESTAVIFTMRTSKFFGLKVTDYDTLTERIKNHKDFNKLLSELKFYINSGSPCPTRHECNLLASDISVKIANEINISDITEKAQ